MLAFLSSLFGNLIFHIFLQRVASHGTDPLRVVDVREIRLPLFFVTCRMKRSYKLWEAIPVFKAVTGPRCRRIQVWFDLAQCIYVVSELCFLVTSPEHLTHFPSRMLPVRSTSADRKHWWTWSWRLIIIFVTIMLWESWAGACVMVNMSSAGVSSRETRFLYNRDPFILSFIKAARTTVSVRETVTRLRYCVIPGFYN